MGFGSGAWTRLFLCSLGANRGNKSLVELRSKRNNCVTELRTYLRLITPRNNEGWLFHANHQGQPLMMRVTPLEPTSTEYNSAVDIDRLIGLLPNEDHTLYTILNIYVFKLTHGHCIPVVLLYYYWIKYSYTKTTSNITAPLFTQLRTNPGAPR